MNQSGTRGSRLLSGSFIALYTGIAFSALATGLIVVMGQFLPAINFLPDQGAFDYYWKLPEPTFWTRISVWVSFILHIVGIWGLIWWAQKKKLRYTNGLHPANWLALGINLVFGLLHFAQTYFFYDGLAQDVHILTSQGSVIILLVLVMIMENPRRGMFFGRKAPLRRELVDWFRTYHGYLFSFAVIYTFWYHPMQATSGHLIGFFYTFLLLLQSSLFFTRAHLNKWWTFSLEFTVLLHGTLVAVMQGGSLWPMFLFGFGGILIITQMHGLGLSTRTRWLIFLSFIAGIALTYTMMDRWSKIDEIIRIPAIDYILIFLIYGIYLGGLGLYRLTRHLLNSSRKIEQNEAA